MPALKSLTFTQLPKLAVSDPVQSRRNRLVERLQQQKSLLADPSFVVKTQRWTRNDQGEKVLREKSRRISPWWRTDSTGTIVLTVRYGAKPIEFEKGKAGIAVGGKDKLVGVIDTLIAAANAGELDIALGGMSRNSTAAMRARKNS